MKQLRGYVERITFQNPENGYTVAQLQEPGKKQLTCIVGSFPGVQPGESLVCHGGWKQHPTHGLQFEVDFYQTEMPADCQGIAKYLGSGLIKGIGAKYAEKIVEKFGTETLNVIDQSPDRLLEVAGIGKGRLEKIKRCWSEQRSIRDLMLFLQRFGVSPTYAQKIFRFYGADAQRKISEDPYCLAREIHGIGFKTADAIAQKMGVEKDSPQRIDAGIEFVLFSLSDEGHTCYAVEEFLPEAETILEVSQPQISARLEVLCQEERLISARLGMVLMDRPFIWLKKHFDFECSIARDLRRLVKAESLLRSIEVSKAVRWVEQLLKIELAPNQAKAVSAALVEKVHIITGGPGTGKSTITNAILLITEQLTARIMLAAPTGRAAKRMSEITKRKASTIHSLLEVDFKTMGFKRNRQNPLECDLLIVDEASMIDTSLMYHLLKAIPSHARVIFIGDINQLPSVGPGNVLKDLIASQKLGVSLLTDIYRQAAGSRIIVNAHRINEGQMPHLDNLPEGDFFFLEGEEPLAVLSIIQELVVKRLPHRYGFDSFQDIQVLAPMKKGVIGTENLNSVLQQTLNPKGTAVESFGRSYRVGDKVMQLRNNYDKEVFNGDIGRVQEIDTIEQQLLVEIEGRQVCYSFEELDELVLAYAVSIHKYQGSECPCVVIPIHTTHFKLLYRNLVYTGVTRGKRLVVLVGTRRALLLAVKNDEVKRRYTGLRQFMRGEPMIHSLGEVLTK